MEYVNLNDCAWSLSVAQHDVVIESASCAYICHFNMTV